MAICPCGLLTKDGSANCERCLMLHVLGLEKGAAASDIKDAYRTLVKVWHPDRFPGDEALRKKAGVKLVAINSAYQYLQTHPATDGTSRQETARPKPASPPKPPPRPETPPQPPPRTTEKAKQATDQQTPSADGHQPGVTIPRTLNLLRRNAWTVPAALMLTLFGLIWILSSGSSESQPKNVRTIPSEEELQKHASARFQNVPATSDSPPLIASANPTPSDNQRETPTSNLSGQEFGTVTNTTSGVVANASFRLTQSGTSLQGCFIVSPPLYGSGPVTGDIQGQTFHLESASQVFSITFAGQVEGKVLEGSYLVHSSSTIPQQLGRFRLVKTAGHGFLEPNGADCPKDSDSAVSSGLVTQP